MPTVYAAHGNYHSRAQETGRLPERPGYFIKPATSLARDGGTFTLPDGVEQVSVEAELALVFGRRAHRLARRDAWSSVAGVSIALDIGVAGRRGWDAGSNVRAKGGPGFTPVAADVLPLADPGSPARVRAWLNGRPVQDAGTDDMVFDLTRLIADLLDAVEVLPGDLLLTGTPAGVFTAAAGDTVEARLDLPDGRVAGPLRIEVAPPVPGTPPEASPSPEELARLADLPTASLDTALHRLGFPSGTPAGVAPLSSGARMLGRARTVRLVPDRPDLRDAVVAPGPHRRTFETLGVGEVVVIEARGLTSTGTVGDILAATAASRGGAGVVTDGAVRDSAAVAASGLPVFAAGRHPAALGRAHLAWEAGGVISCGGVAVAPGDVVVGDDDGVVVLPIPVVRRVVAIAEQIEREDAARLARLAAHDHPQTPDHPRTEGAPTP